MNTTHDLLTRFSGVPVEAAEERIIRFRLPALHRVEFEELLRQTIKDKLGMDLTQGIGNLPTVPDEWKSAGIYWIGLIYPFDCPYSIQVSLGYRAPPSDTDSASEPITTRRL